MTLAPVIVSGEENRERYFTGLVSGRVMSEDGFAAVPYARITPLGVPIADLSTPPPEVFSAEGDGRYTVVAPLDAPQAKTPLLGSSEYVVKVDGPSPAYVSTYQRIRTGPAVMNSDEVFQTKVQDLAVVRAAALADFAAKAGITATSSKIVYGTIIDRATGRPAEGIAVRLLPLSGADAAAMRVVYFNFAGVPQTGLSHTTADGRFIAFNVPLGMVSIDVVSADDTGNLLTESMADGVTLVRLQANNAPPDTVNVVSTLDPLIGTVGSDVNLGVVGGDPLLRKQRCPANTAERGGLCYDSAGVALAKEFVPCDQPRVVRDGYCVIAGVAIPSTGVTVPVGSQSDLAMKTSGVGYLDTYTFGLRTGERASVNAAVGAVRESEVANLALRAGLTRRQGTGLVWGRTTTAGLGDLDAAGNPVPLTCGNWTDLNDASVGCTALGVPGAFVTGHFNADASRDLAVIDTSSDPGVTIWLNRGDGRFLTSQRIVRDLANCYAGTVGCGVENGPSALLVMDFNADGYSDLVVLNRESRTVSLLEGRGRGRFIFWGSLAVGTSDSDFSTMAGADLNRDGRQDLLLTDRVSGQVSLLLGTGSGLRPFRPTLLPVRIGNEPRAVAAGYLDADGIPDLVFANRDSVAVMTRIGVGEILSSYTFPSDQPTDLSAVAVGDLNGDGIHDVVAADAYPGRSRLWIFLQGVTPGAIPTSIALGALPKALALLDVNGDRALDLVVVNQGDGAVSYQVGDGGGGFGAPEILTVGGGPAALVMDDVTGDGRADAVLADPGSRRLLILPHTTRPVEGVAVAAVRVDGRAVGEVVYLDASETAPLPGAVATGRAGRFMILNVPPGPVWLRLLSGGTGSRFLQAYADGVTQTDFPVVTGPTATVFIAGATVDAVVRPVGEVQIRFLGTERATSSSPLVFDDRGNLAGGASYSTMIEANSDYIIRLSK